MENWKDIEGYEDYYQISDQGNVKSIDRIVKNFDGNMKLKGKMLRFNITKAGYFTVCLCKNGKIKRHTVHRLVALMPENKPEVNHKKGNKKDNRATELEWTTPSENSGHAKKVLNVPVYREGEKNTRSKSVIQCSLDGFFIEEYGSINEAGRKTGVHIGGISGAMKGIRQQAGGFLWA